MFPLSNVLRSIVLLGIFSSTGLALQGPYGVGASAEIGSEGTYVSASVSLVAIAIAALMLLTYFALVNIPFEGQEFRVAPIWRRFAATIVDFQLVVFVAGTIVGLVDVLVEAHRTGVFRWHFERNYSVPSDGIASILVILGLAAFVGYLLLPLMRRSQTVGGWIFRIVTVNTDGRAVRLPFSTAMRRLFAGFRGLITFNQTIKRIDEQGRTYYDVESGFMVVRY